jgi:hypothetical protein
MRGIASSSVLHTEPQAGSFSPQTRFREDIYFPLRRTRRTPRASTEGTGDATENIAFFPSLVSSRGADETKIGGDETRLRPPRRHPETWEFYPSSIGKRQTKPGQKAQMTGDRHDQGSFRNCRRCVRCRRSHHDAGLRSAGGGQRARGSCQVRPPRHPPGRPRLFAAGLASCLRSATTKAAPIREARLVTAERR